MLSCRRWLRKQSDGFQLAPDCRDGKRFGKQAAKTGFASSSFIGSHIAGGEQHLEIRGQGAQAPTKLDAIHPGHLQIGDDQLEPFWLGGKRRQRCLRAPELLDVGHPSEFEGRGNEIPDAIIIVNHHPTSMTVPRP